MSELMRPGDVVVTQGTASGGCAKCGAPMEVQYDDVAGRIYVTGTYCPNEDGTHWRANLDAYVAGSNLGAPRSTR